MSSEKKRVLVTGGAGYIGSHACKALAQKNYLPVTLDNLVYGHEWAVKWGPLYKVSLQETDKIADILNREKIEAIVHFAAYAYVGESVLQPLKYYENNFGGTLSLLTASQMAQKPVDKIVFSSTCATYGVPKKMPITESTPQNPINPYGTTKLMIEKILKDLALAKNVRSISLRYFNAAGADSDLEIGEDHNPETHLIPLAIEAIENDKKALTFFGDSHPTPDGTCVRDYIHVTDLAEAHVQALEKLFASREVKATAEIYNLGTGHGQSVQQVIEALQKVTGRKVHFKKGPAGAGDPPELVADVSKAKSSLGWVARHSDIHNILDSAYKWHRKHFL